MYVQSYEYLAFAIHLAALHGSTLEQVLAFCRKRMKHSEVGCKRDYIQERRALMSTISSINVGLIAIELLYFALLREIT